MNIRMSSDYAGKLFWPNTVRTIGQALVLAPLRALRCWPSAPPIGRRVWNIQHVAQFRRSIWHGDPCDHYH
jgi:hypothetical protein